MSTPLQLQKNWDKYIHPLLHLRSKNLIDGMRTYIITDFKVFKTYKNMSSKRGCKCLKVFKSKKSTNLHIIRWSKVMFDSIHIFVSHFIFKCKTWFFIEYRTKLPIIDTKIASKQRNSDKKTIVVNSPQSKHTPRIPKNNQSN